MQCIEKFDLLYHSFQQKYILFRKISTIRLSAFPKKKTRKQVTGLLTGFY